MALPLRYNVLSLLARPTSTISSIVLVSVVIAVFAYLQAVTDSAFNTMSGTGDPNTIIVLSQAAQSETISGLGKDMVNKLEMTPGVGREPSGVIISPELVAISSAFTMDDSEVAVNTSVRGVDFEMASKVRHGKVRIIDGRPFQSGTYEVIVGDSAARLYRDHGIGDRIQLGTRGTRMFEVVGIFSTGGTAADSEIWGYVETLRDVYGREGYSSVRLTVADDQAAREAIQFIDGPSIELNASTERQYFQDLGTNQQATQVLSFVMIVIMGIAASFAVANTMYAAVAGRTREVAMLRAVGFSRNSILTAFLVEGFLLAGAGGVVGVLLSLTWHGLRHNMLPETFTTVSYALRLTPKIAGTSLIAAVAIGVLGSLMPAWRAAKLSVVRALREE